MEVDKIRRVICRAVVKSVCFRRCIPVSVFLFLVHFLAICCTAAELKQKTVEAFDRYIRVTDARMDAALRPDGPFLWVDSLSQLRRQRLYNLLRRGHYEIRQEKTEEEGNPIEVPDGLIHHWTGIAFVPGVSLERALSLLQDYDNHWRTYKPDVRRSKLLEHTNNAFKIYLQFCKDSPRRVSFNTEFEVHYTVIDATHVISRAVSVRIAELEHPEQPDSPEFPVGQGHGYLWRLNNYWRLEEKEGGVYIQLESIALSRNVPAIFAWFVNPLIRRVSRQTLANLLNATRRGLLSQVGAEFSPSRPVRGLVGGQDFSRGVLPPRCHPLEFFFHCSTPFMLWGRGARTYSTPPSVALHQPVTRDSGAIESALRFDACSRSCR